MSGIFQVSRLNTRTAGRSVLRLESLDTRTQFSAPIGWVDGISPGGVVHGWALDPDTATQSINVHMYVDGRIAGGVTAAEPRADVRAALGLPGEGLYGFRLQIPQPFLDGKPHVVHVYGIDSGGAANPALSGSGKVFANAAPIAVLDGVSPGGWASGWMFDPSTPDDAGAVHVYVDGKLEAGVRAAAPRDDVNAVYGITGAHGFGWQLPAQYLDGRPHVVRVYAIDTQGGINTQADHSGVTFRSAPPADPTGPAEPRGGPADAPPAKGVQLVLLPRFSKASMDKLIAVLTAPGSPRSVEIGFGAQFVDKGHPDAYANARRLVDALVRAGKTVWVVTHLSFHGRSVDADQADPTIDDKYDAPVHLADAAAKYSVFVERYARTIAAGRVKMFVSPSLEDEYSQASFEAAAKVIADRLGDRAGDVTFRRSNNKMAAGDPKDSMDHADPGKNFVSADGRTLTFDYEVHGNADRARGFAAYSNDGNFVYFDDPATSRVDETADSAANASNGGRKYSLKDFVEQTEAARPATTLLWRPAYNLYDRKASGRTDRAFDYDLNELVSRRSDGTHFDSFEQRVLGSLG